MKKFISFVAIALLVMGLATTAFGAYASTDLFDTKYTITNQTAKTVATIVPSSLISGDGSYQILSMDVGLASGQTGTSAEIVAGLYDGTTLLHTAVGFLECELESNAYQATASKRWIRPLKIYNGVIVVQGAYSTVTLEYQRAGY